MGGPERGLVGDDLLLGQGLGLGICRTVRGRLVDGQLPFGIEDRDAIRLVLFGDLTLDGIENVLRLVERVVRVVNALISADKANIPLNFKRAAAIDLAGRNVLEAVQTSVDPKVIDCPDPRRHGRNTLDGPRHSNVNLALARSARLGRGLFHLRLEIYNVFDAANFGQPDNFLGSPTFGQILSAGAPRRLQLGLRYGW